MFTGLVEALATVTLTHGDSPRRLGLCAAWEHRDIVVGESIAIDGCCLSVVAVNQASIEFEAATETLKRTTLGSLRCNDEVHVERAMRLSDRLGGHLVSGHIDGVGTVVDCTWQGSALYARIQAPAPVVRYNAPRGSITVCGVSLTITDVEGPTFTVALIPHTLAVTHLKKLRKGTAVNLEVDMVARYVERLLPRGNPIREYSDAI